MKFSLIISQSPKILAITGSLLYLTACNPAPKSGDNHTNSATTSANTSGSNATQLLNVSYDVSRDLYKSYNPYFIDQYEKQHQIKLDIHQSHGGSSKQTLSVINGLKADVVTMNQASDIDTLVKNGLVDKNWQQAFPNNAVPYTSTMIFLVRNGNPKNIKDWQDLARSDVKIVIPNPKTSGTGRYAFLGAYGSGLKQFSNNENQTKDYMKKLLANVVVFDSGSRGATTSFAQREMGDVLITTENEAHLTTQEFNQNKLQIVYPSYSIKINNPVAVVTAVTEQKGTTQVAKDYLQGLWSDNAQTIMAEGFLRPSNPKILADYSQKLPPITTFEATEVFGNWDEIMSKFFKDGGMMDELTTGQKTS